MARLNTHPSATPQQQTRSSTIDSLYRAPSAAPRNESNVRTSSYSVLSPTRSMNSDKENDLPQTRENTPQPHKVRGRRGASARMPTPDSGSTTGDNGNKRRRTGNYTMPESEIFTDELEAEEQEDEEDEDAEEPSQVQPEPEEEGNLRFYNPNQDPDQRRRLRASMRDHQRTVDENRDEMVKPNSKLLDALKTQNNLFGKVRQTADAALDSRFLVNASELAGKKLNNSLQGSAGVGIDLDQFVSKCIYFMKSGGHVAGGEEAPVVPVADGEDEEDGDGLNWALLGRQACFPCNKRPPVSSFLLGPLSVQKRVRTTQRKARSQRQPVGPATRPQEIKEGDIQQSENSNLSDLVKIIKKRLEDHLQRGIAGVEGELSEIPESELQDEDQAAAFRRFRVTQAPTEEAAVGLLDFAINPNNFGQTVENLFYISFLVREGNAKIIKDAEGLPLLIPEEPRGASNQRENHAQKHQAVFSIDYPTWHMFIDAFDIRVPLIPHREQEEATVGSGGWYAG
ncbi:Nse4-domain-containing protein [Cucurbitaria berberidis CBS 394.84]|uniref:Non-structural maintenance of chromosomes element 4 n=1 Tax=Cucurbitaria berberidis CBS 394.84 TaxID=1168544 RepID=A0A9P4GLC6_9PLEO|nr:Nse4-domain-containing protein [Cucurbitaria berberidis CBS 394.84]KAF1847574.1 Nse4-domain-containing protein [Cucurbitaria berberidis CBS 394.84]